jgi:hypothetical protein
MVTRQPRTNWLLQEPVIERGSDRISQRGSVMAVVRPRRVVECGLEVPRGVVYQGWEPGGEYTKTLVVKNVQLRTQRIKYT